jgi:diguanylate cyclase (GGDEF)-like protein
MPANANQKPSLVTTRELFDYIRQLPLSDGEKTKLAHLISGTFSRQRKLMEQSKERAMASMLQSRLEATEELQKRVLSEQATVIEVSNYFERIIGDLRTKLQIDPKTHLLNFEAFREKAEMFFGLEKRSHWCAYGVVDVADFKKINDTFGHLTGDKILERISVLMREQVRTDDLITKERRHEPRPDLHARMGGDEFVFLATDISHCGMTKTIAERFVEAVQEYDWASEDPRLVGVAISVDVGAVCLKMPESRDPESVRSLTIALMRLADELMYRAKRRAKRARNEKPEHHVYVRRASVEEGGKLVFRGCKDHKTRELFL